MTHLLRFDDLQAIFHHSIAHLPDHRKPSPNTRYTIQDAALGAFGLFFTPSPSFLEYQRRLQHTQGHNNAQTLLGVEQIPCDNQVRTLLDPIAPSYLEPVFEEIFKGLSSTACSTTFVCWVITCWSPSMARPTFRPRPSIAPTASPGNSRTVKPSIITPRSPPSSCAQAAPTSSPCPPSTSCRKTGRPNRTANSRRVNGGLANMPRPWRRIR